MEKKITTPVVKGVLISLALILLGLVLYFTGQIMNQGLAALQYVILAGGIIWGCISYSKEMNNNVTFGKVFSHGFKISAVVTVIIIVYSVLSFKLIFPEMMDMALSKTRESLAQKNMSDDQIETAVNMTKKFFIPFMIAGILAFFMIVGLISSLIGAAVSKKNPQSPFQQPV